MSIIKLEPLNKTPLNSQLREKTDCPWGQMEYEGKAVHGGIITHVESGMKFQLASLEEEDSYKAEKLALRLKEAEELSHKYDGYENPIIDYNNETRWKKALDYLHEEPFRVVEMCEEAFWHFLECVPPRIFERTAYASGEAYDHNNNGEGIYLCALKSDGKYYAQMGTLKEFRKRSLFVELP